MPRYQKDLAVLAIAMGLLATGVTFWFRSSTQTRPITLRMTAGDGSGLRHRLASEFAIEASLLDLPPEFPWHDGAELYRQRNKPIIAGDAVDYLEKVLAIAATIAGGTFFLIQWYLRSNRRSREASFASYMERVIQIENESMQNELAAQLDLATLIRLQRELAVLKSDAVSKFAAGKLEGEGLIHGFLALVNDARNQLTRLILHQRENIEQLAATQNHTVDEVWLEQSQATSTNASPNA